MFHILQNGPIHCIAVFHHPSGLLCNAYWCILAVVYSAEHWLFIKYKQYSPNLLLLLLLLHKNICFLRWKCAHGPRCTIVHYKLCNVLYVLLFNVQYVMHTLQRDFVQRVTKNMIVLSQDLDYPYYLCISMCSCKCKSLHMFRFLHNGHRPRKNLVGVNILVIVGPNKLAKPSRCNNLVSFGSNKFEPNFCVLNLTIWGKSFVDPSLPKDFFQGGYVWIMAVLLGLIPVICTGVVTIAPKKP